MKTGSIKPMIILTTAYSEYALAGYELDVIDYLVKPISLKRFTKAVQKAREYAELRNSKNDSQVSFIFVKSERKIEKIEIDHILFIESAGNYITIHTENKKITAYLTLKGIENQLTNSFIKVHHSFLVNFKKIEAIDGYVIKIENKSVPISRQYKDNLMEIVVRNLLKR
ncbi:MAG TPA: LytTR family DNA-binding domain-containing protein [Flavitalea sp.]|nr:LytTR family DNA-binding domain-containing protein [Flavitalea sp.]